MSRPVVEKSFSFGSITAAGGTPWSRIIPPVEGRFIKVQSILATMGASTSLSFLRPIASAKLTAAAAAGQAVMALSSVNPGKDSSGVAETLAANDLLLFQDVSGIWRLGTVSSVASLNVTLNANLATQVPKDRIVYLFYEPGRASHVLWAPGTGLFSAFSPEALATTRLTKEVDPHNFAFCCGTGNPALIYSNNAATSTLHSVSGSYSRAS